MEQLGSITAVAFDKTGTLTLGAPQQTDLQALDEARYDTDTILTWAAAAEHPSEHPLAQAIVAAAAERGLRLPTAEGFDSTPGSGVRATVDGHTVEVGSPRHLLYHYRRRRHSGSQPEAAGPHMVAASAARSAASYIPQNHNKTTSTISSTTSDTSSTTAPRQRFPHAQCPNPMQSA